MWTLKTVQCVSLFKTWTKKQVDLLKVSDIYYNRGPKCCQMRIIWSNSYIISKSQMLYGYFNVKINRTMIKTAHEWGKLVKL
jgi:hypothetical protein